ncbi:hypothetical protein K2173_016618 [Erythroxylum novogranatense]|uniref:RIN4 pathogenic type III effector avirulence factor Avr cleavage site domain-containing protein n=1 Tax=Erythroxylum novogranatense TaxID=1862640 RepID=A0AAV8SHE8_9ROSI|nr:hypothetical protein K2173_016618 [Erythroxylum novogranatense]
MFRKENGAWISVPQFGGWDSKSNDDTNYSVLFSQARAKRKEHKYDPRHASLGNEREIMNAATFNHHRRHHRHHQEDSVTPRRRLLTYINCCIRPSW